MASLIPFTVELADAVTQAGGLVLGILFRVAGVATALLCMQSGIKVIRGALMNSSSSVTDGLMSLSGVLMGAIITFKAPDIAAAVLESAGGSGALSGGPFAAVVNDLLRQVQRIGIVVATLGFVWHGTFALVEMAGQGGGSKLGELVPKYVGLTLTMIALWKVPEIVGALQGAFTHGF